MSITISEEFKSAIDNIVKNNSWKEQLYDIIDKLEKSDLYTTNSLVIEYASDHSYPIRHYLMDDNVAKVFKKDIADSLIALLQETKKSEFISTYDKQIINMYADLLKEIIINHPHVIYSLHATENKLINKISKEAFAEWLKDFNPINLIATFSKIVDESVIKYDTNRYDDKTVECFLKATLDSDPAEATSECQYALHRTEFMGELSTISHKHNDNEL